MLLTGGSNSPFVLGEGGVGDYINTKQHTSDILKHSHGSPDSIPSFK